MCIIIKELLSNVTQIAKKIHSKKNLFYPSRKCDAHSLELKYPRSCRSFLNHGYSKSCLMSCWELPTFCIEISAAAARGGGLGGKHFSGPPINGRFPAALKWRCQNAPRGSFINWAIPTVVYWLRINKARNMLQVITFQDVLTNTKSAVTIKPSWFIFTITETFPIRYCMTLYLNQNTTGQNSKFNFYWVNLEFSSFTCCILYSTWGIGS